MSDLTSLLEVSIVHSHLQISEAFTLPFTTMLSTYLNFLFIVKMVVGCYGIAESAVFFSDDGLVLNFAKK